GRSRDLHRESGWAGELSRIRVARSDAVGRGGAVPGTVGREGPPGRRGGGLRGPEDGAAERRERGKPSGGPQDADPAVLGDPEHPIRLGTRGQAQAARWEPTPGLPGFSGSYSRNRPLTHIATHRRSVCPIRPARRI